jgi:hypothetical protein
LTKPKRMVNSKTSSSVKVFGSSRRPPENRDLYAFSPGDSIKNQAISPTKGIGSA